MGKKQSRKVKVYSHICKYHKYYTRASNIFIAISMAGLALLGVLNTVLTVSALILWGMFFAGMYALGKFMDQEVEDFNKSKEGKVCELPKHYSKRNDDRDHWDISG